MRRLGIQPSPVQELQSAQPVTTEVIGLQSTGYLGPRASLGSNTVKLTSWAVLNPGDPILRVPHYPGIGRAHFKR